LDDVLNLDNPFFDNKVSQIYPPELSLLKANLDDTEASFLDLHLQINDGIVSTKIYDKRDDFDFEIVNYPQLLGDVPPATSYGVYISQLVRFARACSDVSDFNERNHNITSKLLTQGFRYHKLRRTFSKFFKRYSHYLSKYNTCLKDLLKSGISHPLFYGDFVYKLRKIKSSCNIFRAFPKIVSKFINRGYDCSILHSTSTLVLDHCTVDQFAHCFYQKKV